MASVMNNISRVVYKLRAFSSKGTIGIHKIQFLRYQSIVSHKLVYSEYGDAVKVIRQEQEDLQAPKSNEVIVRMLAAPVNPADINTIQGVYPIKPPLPSVAGNEGVGEIESVGSDVKGFQKGDRVLPGSSGLGTWRSYSVCNERDVIKIPKEVGVVEAATLTVNPCTAFRMLRDFVSLNPGDTVIQNGANSAVGQNVIQICKARGINSVNIVRNRENINELKAFLMKLGATQVLIEEEMRTTDIFKKKLFRRPQLALNCIGGKNALEMLRHVDRKGVMVTYGGMSREPVTVPTSALIFKDIAIRGFWMTQWTVDNVDKPKRTEMFDELVQMIIKGELKAPVHKLVPFNNYKEALMNTMSIKGFSGLKYVLNFQEM